MNIGFLALAERYFRAGSAYSQDEHEQVIQQIVDIQPRPFNLVESAPVLYGLLVKPHTNIEWIRPGLPERELKSMIGRDNIDEFKRQLVAVVKREYPDREFREVPALNERTVTQWLTRLIEHWLPPRPTPDQLQQFLHDLEEKLRHDVATR